VAEQVQIIGGIDAGGTTFKCGVSDDGRTLRAARRITVTTPAETLDGCAAFFRSAVGADRLVSLGIASFGPIDVDPCSAAYGTILTTPKPGWAQTDLRRFFQHALGVSAIVDTDVNGALLAEMTHGAAAGAASAAYITVGTGIGGGIQTNGVFAGRPSHPEFGHIPVRRPVADGDFPGTCPFHGDCLEGVASVTAIRARWGEPMHLAQDHAGWPIIADYLAQACRVLTLTLRLERIIIGGGLMLAPHLLARVQLAYDDQMGAYLGEMSIPGRKLIDRPGLGDDAGLVGALLLAARSAAPDNAAAGLYNRL
jgi:fructokinase